MAADGPTGSRTEGAAGQQPTATVIRGALRSTIEAIARLQVGLVTSRVAIEAANLGPYKLGGSCDYDRVLGVCWKTYTWSWGLDFENLRVPLTGTVQQVGRAADAFGTAFSPVRSWLRQTLPQFSADFDVQAQTILATNAAIVSAGGQATPEQQAAVQAAFKDLLAGITVGQQQIEAAISAMSAFNTQLTSCDNALGQITVQQQSSIDALIGSSWNAFVGGMECGQDDAQGQVRTATATFNDAISHIQASFATLQAKGSAVASAAGQLGGVLVEILDQYGQVARQLEQAQAYPAGAIADLHVDIAASEWKQLAQYAQASIQ